ncbi:MAG TPA: SusC/RagA family TonB-linked outer membrane protein, partial [Anseongella sp.]
SLPFRNVGLAGRATYSYDERYYAEVNFGYNGSERFHKSHRYGFFPSAGVAWTISNEKFWEPLERTVNNFRLRATYGLSGNDAIGSARDRFLYLSNVNMNSGARSAVFGRDNGYSQNGISISRYADPSITWETASKLNLGLEIGLFDKANIVIDAYRDHRENILMTRTATPAEMGLSAQPQTNIGEASAQGIDLQMDYNHVINKDFWVQLMGNFTYATSEFEVYEEYDYDNEWWKSRIGYPITQQWGYIAERLFVDNAEVAKSPFQNFGEYMGGDIKYRDVNGDGQISTLDQVPIGYPTTPEIVYGFGFSVGYKAFDFSAFFQGSARSSFWINPIATAPFLGYVYDNETLIGIPQNQLLKAYADDYWSETDRDLYALWPRLSTTAIGTDNNSQRSTWFMRDGTFLRLKQVELGYTLPEPTAQKLFMQSLRIYLSGTNLFTWSKFKLWDVEMGNNGLGYPNQRVLNIGVLANF